MKKMIQAALFCALMVVCSWVALPLPGVSLTLQTLAVALCGYCLSWKYALAAVSAYLLLGGFGLPVFSGFSGGIGWLLGPSGGFLFGFLALAAACGLPFKRRALRRASGAVGLVVLHLCGAGWFALATHSDFWDALPVCSLPFLVKDALCIGAAEFASNKIGVFKKIP
jgi:biotin transport system substrate-specific component